MSKNDLTRFEEYHYSIVFFKSGCFEAILYILTYLLNVVHNRGVVVCYLEVVVIRLVAS